MYQNEVDNIQHICYIMDGDRTYAITKKVQKLEINNYAYYSGFLSLERLMEMTFKKIGIKYLSINLVGRRNCYKRPESIKKVVELTPTFFGKKWIQFFIRNKIRVKFFGDLELFCNLSENPLVIKEEIKKIEDITSKFEEHFLLVMAAYEPFEEYKKLFKISNSNDLSIEEAKLKYYGFSVPDVNFIIRTWRPKFTGCLPIMLTDYSDIYFFTAPFQYFKLKDLKSISEDYLSRSTSSSTNYTDNDILTIQNNGESIKAGKIYVLGKKINNIWLPLNK